MNPNDLRQLLEQVRAGQVSIDDALQRVGPPPVADLGFAHVDLHRQARCHPHERERSGRERSDLEPAERAHEGYEDKRDRQRGDRNPARATPPAAAAAPAVARRRQWG